MDNAEKLAKQVTQNKEKNKKKQNKPNTMCVGHHYPQANTNNVNKPWALLQTTGGKDEQNIVCMRKSQHGTQNVKSHNRRTQTTKKMNNKEYLLILIGIWLLYSIKLRPTWIHFREYRKANQKLEINFVNKNVLNKIKTGYKQIDEGGFNTQYKSN
jgi:hypothetical protein